MDTFEANWESGTLVTAEAASGIGFGPMAERDHEQEQVETGDSSGHAAD